MHIISFINKKIGKKWNKINGQNHHREDKKGRPKKRSKDKQPARILKREKANPSHGMKLFHPQPF